MNTKRLFKIAAFASTVAVLTGVVTFNIGSVVGAPTQSPPGNNISPTFNGVKVTGDTAVNQIVSTSPGTAIKVNENVSINGSITSLKSLDLSVDIKNSTGGPVKISDDLDATGLIQNNSANNLGYVRVKDDLSVDGDLIVFYKDLVMTGIESKIRSSGSQPVEFGSDIITKNINVNGTSYLTNSADKIVKIGSSTNKNDLSINGNQTMTGYLTVGKDQFLTADKITSSSPGTGKAIIFNTPIKGMGNLVVDTDLTSKKNITAEGGIWAKQYLVSNGDFELNGQLMHDDQFVIRHISEASTLSLTKDSIDSSTGTLNLLDNVAVSGKLSVGGTGYLQIPSGDGRIINDEGNAILQTWWDGTFGDYTAINSGYAWTGSEPVSVVAGANGVYFMKGSAGKAYKSQLGKIDLSGNMTVAGKVTATGYVTSSSKRFKENIKDIEDTSWLYKLNPVSYNYISDKNKDTQYGLIAEEVEKVNADLVTYDENGKTNGVLYNNLIGPIVQTLQDQKKEIDQLKKENAEIKAALCEIKADLEICN